MDRLRIAMISTPFVRVPPEGYGGTELVVWELTRALEQAGHQVTLFATGDSEGASEVLAYFREAQWPPSPQTEWLHCVYATRQIEAESRRFDVIHSHCGAMLALRTWCPLPLVHTIHHDLDPTQSRYYRSVPDVSYVAISDSQRCREAALPRVGVVHHGLDPSRYFVGPDAGYALFMGRFSAEKGPHVAIDVARAAGVPLVLAGRIHEADYFRTEMAPRIAQEGVCAVGEVGGRRKFELLAGARALLFPIDWEEPFGLVMIEAMLSGVPVLAPPRGSVSEVVDEGVTGFVVGSPTEMADRLRRLDGFDRAHCRAAAVRRFSAATMTANYLDVYRSAIDAFRAHGREARADPFLQAWRI